MKNIPFKRRGQSWQDLFAYDVCGTNGTYIEIGAYKPGTKNNTYALEVDCGWRGFSIEFNSNLKPYWDECTERKNPIFWGDAMTFDYRHQLKKLAIPSRVSFLSCDIEPPANTFVALTQVINQGITFDCITFEHDKSNPAFSYETVDYENKAKNFLVSKGYKIAVYDVYPGKDKEYMYETWFVNNDIDYPSMSYEEWKEWVVNK